MKTDLAKEKLVQAAQHFKRLGYLAAADGNFSCRLEGGRVLMTPSGRNKEFIKSEDIAMLDLSGIAISGEPSSEKMVHLGIYNQMADAQWIMHAHPPYSIAWSINQPDAQELDISALPEVILGAGRIPIVPYAMPGQLELAERLARMATQHKAMIMQRHGVICWGETWEECINGIERVEHAAKVLAIALTMGGYAHLDDSELIKIKNRRKLTGEILL